jgi:hypothetical protein
LGSRLIEVEHDRPEGHTVKQPQTQRRATHDAISSLSSDDSAGDPSPIRGPVWLSSSGA